ncbi:hypothetical protein F4859DRAFT_476774 [Xylaria cf. heliscus]|nr:hypothetical protein F4859DRAFT_476774 [Xylaria cf. heliscus]
MSCPLGCLLPRQATTPRVLLLLLWGPPEPSGCFPGYPTTWWRLVRRHSRGEISDANCRPPCRARSLILLILVPITFQ